MNNQGELFPEADDRMPWQRSELERRVDADLIRLGLTDHEMARTTDPETSHIAARKNRVTRKNQRGRILMAHFEEGPMTDEECQTKLGIRMNSMTRRTELFQAGFLENSGTRRRTSTGSEAIVWKITPEGEALARRLLMEEA